MRLRVGWAALLFACGSKYAEELPLPADGPNDAGLADADTAEAAVGPAPDEPPVDAGSCASPTVSVAHLADNALLSATSPDQPRPDISICNMSVGACLFRFDLSAPELDAIQKNRVTAAVLVLTRATASDECGDGGGGSSCIAFRDDGILSASPVRTDWGQDTVTWNDRRKSSNPMATLPWEVPGALGASDIGSPAGMRAVSKNDETASIALDTSQWSKALLDDNQIGVRTTFTEGQVRRPFLAVLQTPNSNQATPYTPPSLTISYCPSN